MTTVTDDEVAELRRERDAALAREAALAEVLNVINGNPGDPQPAYDAILEAVLRLSDSAFGAVQAYDGERVRSVALRGLPVVEDAETGRSMPVDPGTLMHRIVMGEDVVSLPDVRDDDAYRSRMPSRVRVVEVYGARTQLMAGLRKEGRLLGFINIYGREVRPFTETQLSLVKSFAAQAVIAMENARLVTEAREALGRQTAMTEVLAVINASPGDPQPVFDVILQKAHDLCGAESGALTLYDGQYNRCIATHGLPAEFAARLRQPFAAFGMQAWETGQRYSHVPDIRAVAWPEDNWVHHGLVAFTRTRTRLTLPMHKDGKLIGLISANRPEIRPFTEAEITLLENFAAQAVIAMENARLLGELRTALETTQTALRELKVAQANLVQSEKMASLGQLTAGIAHEIKNPLNFVNNFANLSVELLDEFKEAAAPGLATLTDDQRANIDDLAATLTSNLKKIEEHGKRADNIVKSMLEHSRGASAERRPVDLNALVEEALNLAYHGARAQDQSFNVTLERDFATALAPIVVNPQDVSRAMLNIIGNGFYAINKRAKAEPGHVPTLKVSTRELTHGVEIRVRDNGTGIPPDIRDKLFEPFFTTKPTGEGTGLGLSITYDIVTKQHGGSIAVDSEAGVFTEFSVTLPR